MKNFSIPILLCITLLVSFLVSCKKESKEWTEISVSLSNPVTNEPYKGVEMQIILNKKEKKFGLEYDHEVESIWKGSTDENGLVEYRFHAIKNDDYFYTITPPNLPSSQFQFEGNYVPFNQIPQENKYLAKHQANNRNYEFVKTVSFVHHFKNTNCLNANDKVRYRYKCRLTNFNWTDWSNYDIENSGFGCVDFISGKFFSNQDIREYELEVTRNGNSEIIPFSFNVFGQNGIDTLKLFY